MNGFAYKIGLRLSRIGFVRRAIEERTDLREFRKPPTPKIVAGMVLIPISFAMSWPLIGAIGAMSIYYHKPLLVAILGPILYGSSHLVYLWGLKWSGEKHVPIFFKWLARITTEKLLATGKSSESAESQAVGESFHKS